MAYDLTQAMYYVFPSYTAGLTKAQQIAQQLGTDGVQTVYWYQVFQLTTGEGAAAIFPGDPYYGTTVTIGGKTYTMSQAEINRLVPYSAIVGKLPPSTMPPM